MTLTASTRRTSADRDLRSDVEAELERDMRVPSGSVSISVTDKTVTLAGSVDTRANRLAALEATYRVGGLHTIIDDIVVVPVPGASEPDVALAIERVLEAIGSGASGLKATVRAGVVTLTGRVASQIQKSSACCAIGEVRGVAWIENHIVVDTATSAEVVHARIVAAMHRSADADARAISVVAREHEVWLHGHAASDAIRSRAVLAAWSAPGVGVVHDNLRVGPSADHALGARFDETADRGPSPLIIDGRGCTS